MKKTVYTRSRYGLAFNTSESQISLGSTEAVCKPTSFYGEVMQVSGREDLLYSSATVMSFRSIVKALLPGGTIIIFKVSKTIDS